jgi:hypothetical protein
MNQLIELRWRKCRSKQQISTNGRSLGWKIHSTLNATLKPLNSKYNLKEFCIQIKQFERQSWISKGKTSEKIVKAKSSENQRIINLI